MKILFYGRLRDAAGDTERIVDLPADVRDADSLRAWLGADNPHLLEGLRDRSVRMIVNDELVHGNPTLAQGDEVEFLSPVSGG